MLHETFDLLGKPLSVIEAAKNHYTKEEADSTTSLQYTTSGYTNKPQAYVETATPYTIIDPNTDPLNVDGRLIAPSTQNIVTPPAPFSGETSASLTDTSRTETGLTTTGDVSKGDFVVYENPELVTNGTFDTDTSGWSNPAPTRSTISWDATGKLKMDATLGDGGVPVVSTSCTLVVGKQYILEYTASTTDGAVTTGYLNGTTIKSASGTMGYNRFIFTATDNGIQLYGDYPNIVLFDNISVKLADDKYQAIQDAPSGTSLTNTSYFQSVDAISRQDLVVHKFDKTTYAHTLEAVKGTETFDNEVDYVDRYYGSPDSNGLWSTIDDYILSNITTSLLNAGIYDATYNPNGTAISTGGSPTSAYDCFTFTKTGGNIASASTAHPSGRYYDGVYIDSSVDLRLCGLEPDIKGLLSIASRDYADLIYPIQTDQTLSNVFLDSVCIDSTSNIYSFLKISSADVGTITETNSDKTGFTIIKDSNGRLILQAVNDTNSTATIDLTSSTNTIVYLPYFYKG